MLTEDTNAEVASTGAEPVRRLKILHLGKFYPPHHGGMESHLQTLCEQIKDRVDLDVVVSNDGPVAAVDEVNGVRVTRLGTVATVASTSLNLAMLSRIRRSDADIVHLHWPNPSATLAYLLSGHKGRLVVSYHSDVIRQKMLGRLFEPMLQKLLQKASTIIASSPNYVESSASLVRHRDRCEIIPFGIDAKFFDPPNEEAVRVIRARHGGKLVLSVGRLVYYKGFGHLITAMARTQGTLLIAGTGPLEAELRELARTLGIADRVVFLGSPGDEELQNLYHAADIFVLASIARSEAFGLVQAEAMAAGKPVVNTRLESGVPFVSIDGETGITVAPSDYVALADAINLLLDDDGLRREYGLAARRRAEEVFRCSVMADSTLRAYRDLAGVLLEKCAAAYA